MYREWIRAGNRGRKALAALVLALLLGVSPAWAEAQEVDAVQVEAQPEEAGTLMLGAEPVQTAEADEAPEQVWTAKESAPAGAEDFGRASYQDKGEYSPSSYDVHITRNISGTLYVGDSLELTFTGGAFKSLVSKSPKVAQIEDADAASGTARVVALREGKSKVKAKLASGKKVTVMVYVRDPAQPTGVSLGSARVLRVGDKVTLKPELTPATAITTYKWSTSEKKVATVSDTGVVTALRAGTAKITVKTANDQKASVEVTVQDGSKPESVSIAGGDVTLNVGESVALTARLTPDDAATAFTWSSSKKAVAEVSDSGVVTGVKAGTAKITVKTANGKKDTVEVKVTDLHAPEAVSLEDQVLGVGDTLTLKPVLTPSSARTTCTWSTSDKKVATVNQDGAVTGVKAGKAKITVKTANGKKAVCTVTVQSETVTGTRYRALLVANDDFYWGFSWDRGSLNRAAANKFKNALSKVKGAQGGSYSVTVKNNLDRDGLTSAISAAFASADDNDVSLIYFASHGDSFSSDSYAGALLMASVEEETPEYMKLSDFAGLLAEVPGRVVVILDTCGSGAGVYAKGEAAPGSCDAFDGAVVRAFSRLDDGLPLNEGDAIAKTGELRRVNKFYVLTSSKYKEDSWAYEDEDGGGSIFTDWLTEAMGASGSMPADVQYAGNKDGKADLWELYSYISGVGDHHGIPSGDKVVYQHVQVYPSETRFELFK